MSGEEVLECQILGKCRVMKSKIHIHSLDWYRAQVEKRKGEIIEIVSSLDKGEVDKAYLKMLMRYKTKDIRKSKEAE